jgi:hypothetical protein
MSSRRITWLGKPKDRGIVMLRDLAKREIEKVRRGEDPMGVERNPEHPIIDTNVDEGVRQMKANARASGQAASEQFQRDYP